MLPTEKVCDVFDKLDDLEKSLDHDTKSALVHIAGYMSRHDDENIDYTIIYYEKFGSFASYLNRGKFNIPGDPVCQCVFFPCRKSPSNLLMLTVQNNMS